MKSLFLLILPFFIFASSLKSLLDHAVNNNRLVVSKTLIQEAKQEEVAAKQSAYYPTLDAGASFQSLNERSPFQPGDAYGVSATIGLDIYDGGRKSALLEQKRSEYKASSYDTKALKTSISLQIVQDFYTIKTLEASLSSRTNAKKSLQAQLNRIKKFYDAKLATIDDVDRLQAAFDTNIFEIESIKFDILARKRSLQLKVGKKIGSLDASIFKRPSNEEYELVDSTKSLIAQEEAIISGAESLDSIYYPNLRVEDTYSVYGYDRTDVLHPEGPEQQNKILLTVNMRLFDAGSVQQEKQAVLLKSQSLNEKIQYQKEEQEIQFDLSLSRIQTSKIKIQSAQSALVSSKSAFKTIEEKYNAGIVDNVVYLDALSLQTSAQALYKGSLNDLEIAYAIYYYYTGKNIGDYL